MTAFRHPQNTSFCATGDCLSGYTTLASRAVQLIKFKSNGDRIHRRSSLSVWGRSTANPVALTACGLDRGANFGGIKWTYLLVGGVDSMVLSMFMNHIN